MKLYRKRLNGKEQGIDIFATPGEDGEKVKKKSSTRKYICPKCGMSVRATKVVRIAYIECDNTQMQEVV